MSTIFADKFKNTSGGNPVQINQLRGIDTAGSITVQGEGTATTNLQQGLSKSWMNLNGTSTIATRDSFNVSTVVDRGTGLYTQRFTSNMSNDDYAVGGSGMATHKDADGRNRIMVGDPQSTSDIHVNTFTTSGGAEDIEYVAAIAHGDLA
jgi:hypothetical protein